MTSPVHTVPERERPGWFDRLPSGALSALAFLLLGPAAAYLVLVAIPRGFEIESSCLTSGGVQKTSGDTFVGAFVVLGTLGWIAAFLGAIYASIADRRGIVVLLPLVWFAVLVLSAFVVAAVLGPVPCPP
jgi:hypothetical protein